MLIEGEDARTFNEQVLMYSPGHCRCEERPLSSLTCSIEGDSCGSAARPHSVRARADQRDADRCERRWLARSVDRLPPYDGAHRLPRPHHFLDGLQGEFTSAEEKSIFLVARKTCQNLGKLQALCSDLPLTASLRQLTSHAGDEHLL